MYEPSSEKSTTGRSAAQLTITAVSWLFPSATARLAERVFLTSRRSLQPPRETQWAALARRTTIPFASYELAAWQWGQGERTILLVHGWAGRGLQLGALTAQLTDHGVRTITWDGPGHGQSPGRSSSMPELAAGIAAVARSVGPVHGVVAHSLGSAAVLLAMTRGQLRPDRIVLLAPSARFDSILAEFSRLTGFSSKVLAKMKQRLGRRFSFDWEASSPLRLAPTFTQPALIVHDRDDREVEWSQGAELARAWPSAKLLSTSGLGHRRLLRDPGVIDSVCEFVTAEGTPHLSEERRAS